MSPGALEREERGQEEKTSFHDLPGLPKTRRNS